MHESAFPNPLRARLLRSFFWTVISVLFCELVLGVFFPKQGRAATADSSCAAVRVQQVAEGIAALERDAEQQAIHTLQRVVEAEPSCYTDAYGTAAYWLGVAYHRAGRDDRQLDTWRQGVGGLLRSEIPFDMRLAKAYIHHVFAAQDGTHYQRATRAYLRLIEQTGQPTTDWERGIHAQHLRLVAAVLPPAMRSQVGLSDSVDESVVAALPEDVGRQLVAWWHGQDPLPATPVNERLEEHLERVAHVQNQFQTDGRVDDRGLIFVRLGAPSRKATIQFNSIRFNQSVLSFDSRFSMTDFRSARFWVYDHVSRATQYLFVEVNRDVFEVGNAVSMLPSELQRGFSSSHRGQEAAEAFVRAMEEAYSQLAVYHDRYHAQHQLLANYVLDLDAESRSGTTGRGRTVRQFARTALLNIKEDDEFHRNEREAETPVTYSSGPPDPGSIPISVRHARFLRPDGTTCVEVFWSAPYSGLLADERRLTRDKYLLHTALVKRRVDGERVTTRRMRNVVQERQTDENAFLLPQTYHLHAKAEQVFQFDLQWDQFEATPTSDEPVPGELVGRYVYRSDTLRTLDVNKSGLVLSDLRPMVVPKREGERQSIENALPYPFSYVTPSTPLALYVEAYHLSFDHDDRTRYTVAYEVRRRTERGGLARLFRGGDTRQTTTETTYEGHSRRAEEYIMLDLSTWSGESDLRVTVRIIDEVTGQRKERSLELKAVR